MQADFLSAVGLAAQEPSGLQELSNTNSSSTTTTANNDTSNTNSSNTTTNLNNDNTNDILQELSDTNSIYLPVLPARCRFRWLRGKNKKRVILIVVVVVVLLLLLI